MRFWRSQQPKKSTFHVPASRVWLLAEIAAAAKGAAVAFQKRHFCSPKEPQLHSKNGIFVVQKWHYCSPSVGTSRSQPGNEMFHIVGMTAKVALRTFFS